MSREAASYSELVHRAADFAARAHDGQYRKEKIEKIPYVSHLAMVARLLEQAGFDEEVVAAGYLHDAVEDTGATSEELAARFGERVAALVDHVTEQDKSLPWAERKKRYLERLDRAPFEALALSCADKIHNLRSFVLYTRAGGEVWAIVKAGREAQLEQFDKLAALYRARFDHPLRVLFEEALEMVKKEC
jgi:(p)ppGpp synthase/HD superfamily hydrolase